MRTRKPTKICHSNIFESAKELTNNLNQLARQMGFYGRFTVELDSRSTVLVYRQDGGSSQWRLRISPEDLVSEQIVLTLVTSLQAYPPQKGTLSYQIRS